MSEYGPGPTPGSVPGPAPSPDVDFAGGHAERQPVILLLDTSASMGRPAESPRIDELNEALVRWFAGVRADPRLSARVEVCLITFDSRVRVFDPVRGTLVAPEDATVEGVFVPVGEMRPPRLRAAGLTRMTDAVEAALDLARARHQTHQRRRAPARRPFLWVLTDGAPSDANGEWLDPGALADTAERVRRGEERGEWVFQAIGVRGADLELLRVLTPQGALTLAGFDFGQICDLVFQSSCVIGAVQGADEIHGQVADLAERQRRLRLLEERYQ